MPTAVTRDRAPSIHPPPGALALVQQARAQWLQGLASALPALGERLAHFLVQLSARQHSPAEEADWHATSERFRRRRNAWIQACSAALQAAQTRLGEHSAALTAAPLCEDPLEHQRLACQLALAASERVGDSFEALRLRSQWLQQHELAANDPLRPEIVCQLLVAQWQAVGLPRDDLRTLTAPLQAALGELLQAHYTALHQLYDRQRVPPSHDLAPLCPGSNADPAPQAPPAPSLQQARASAQQASAQLLQWLATPNGEILPGQEALATAAQALLVALTAADPQTTPQPPLHPPATPLPSQADTHSAPAAVAIVAQLFQDILGEERVPPTVRVWLARLQVPVLRVALAEPALFAQRQHPARRLIDRLGGCLLGFAASGLESRLLETEIRRLVRLIEQYAETGPRVFALALREFDAFVTGDLTQEPPSPSPVSLGQQVEQKETLTIQYTIELRRMLKDMPVRAALRDFLFNHWAEVLALSALRHGAMHAQTVAFKQAASDLIGAASAQPPRAQRAQLGRSRSQLLQRLREGLTLVGMPHAWQTQQLEPLIPALTEGLTPQTTSIAPADLDRMARRLGPLEDFMAEEAQPEDAALAAEYLERLLGVDIANLHVLGSTTYVVNAAWLRATDSLQPGDWFTLAHHGANVQVQYVWRGRLCQLHLFASLAGTCYVLTQQRLAHVLESGLLRRHDAEGLRR